MKTINIIRRIAVFPFKILISPIIFIIGFLMTDFENKISVSAFKTTMSELKF